MKKINTKEQPKQQQKTAPTRDSVKEQKNDPKHKTDFTNHNEDAMVAQNKAEQATQDGSKEAFAPQGDSYYAHQSPAPLATTVVEKKETYGIPAGGISSAPTSHVDPEAAVKVDKGDGHSEYRGGESYPDNTGTAADGFMPRQGGEIPAKPYMHKDDQEKRIDHKKENLALQGNYKGKSD